MESLKKHDNIVLGDPETADVIFTAHYDTPWRAFVPNLMLPVNKPLFYLYNFAIAFILLAIALLGAKYVTLLSGLDRMSRAGRAVWMAAYLILYIGLFILLLFSGKNKHNCNDNTSGVAAVLETYKRLNGDKRAAFILFDDEEKGKLGSKAFASAHAKIKAETLLINLDCVANGGYFIIGATAKAKNSPFYKLLTDAFISENGFEALFYDADKIAMNSDQKNFDVSLGVCACKKGKSVGYYCDRIHTKYDTVASEDNISYVTNALSGFVDRISQ